MQSTDKDKMTVQLILKDRTAEDERKPRCDGDPPIEILTAENPLKPLKY